MCVIPKLVLILILFWRDCWFVRYFNRAPDYCKSKRSVATGQQHWSKRRYESNPTVPSALAVSSNRASESALPILIGTNYIETGIYNWLRPFSAKWWKNDVKAKSQNQQSCFTGSTAMLTTLRWSAINFEQGRLDLRPSKPSTYNGKREFLKCNSRLYQVEQYPHLVPMTSPNVLFTDSNEIILPSTLKYSTLKQHA